MSEPTTTEVLQRLGFRELALRFLDGQNPQPHRAIVIADAIVSFDGELGTDGPLRYLAHDFVQEAMRIIEREEEPRGLFGAEWLKTWNKKFGVN